MGPSASAYQKVCPRFQLYDKMKKLLDRGLTTQEKQCIERALSDIDQNPEMKGQIYLRYPPEDVVALTALGNRCVPSN
jgi:hypothetical protein